MTEPRKPNKYIYFKICGDCFLVFTGCKKKPCPHCGSMHGSASRMLNYGWEGQQ